MPEAPPRQRYDQACDFLEDDLDSGYVRLLQELITAGWSEADLGRVGRATCSPVGTACW